MSFFRLRRFGSTLLTLCSLTFLPVHAQVANQITKPVNVAVRHTFTNTVPAQVRAASDLGKVSTNLPMQDMVMLLKGNATQSAALTQFIADAHNPKSPNYRQWLTPAEFGARFGASDQDVQTVSTWLASNGFSVTAVARGKNWIRFSGQAAQVEQAFGTEMHQFSLANKTYHSNSTEISIPAALSPVVSGLVSLNDFVKPSLHTTPAKVMRGQNGRLQRVAGSTPAGVKTDGGDSALLVQPSFTSQGTPEEVLFAPGDFSRVYNTLPLISAGTDGTGVSIAIVGRSDISLSDVESFRTIFGLPFNDPTIINANADPGVVPGDDEEAILDLEWSGAVAPKAKINYVVGGSTNTTDGVDISASYIVDNVTAPIMSVSFGACEAEISPTESDFYNSLWAQAAAEGITVFVSSGDAGSSECDIPNEYIATNYGLGVSGLASTPYNVAVGGTEFAEPNINTFWNTTLNPDLSSAKGYVPEAVWNESCNPNLPIGPDNCYFDPTAEGTYAGAGGASNCSQHPDGASPNILTGLYACSGGYPKPSWQTGKGVPTDGARDLPDVSLAAAQAHDGFLICYDGSCQYTTNPDGSITLDSATIIGGTSAASPSMAGIMALVEQKNGSFQGQANYKLYQLAAAQPSSLDCNSSDATDPTQSNACVFHDVTAGSNALSCLLRNKGDCSVPVAGSTSYGILDGNSAGAGYDLASGLGSINAANLVSAWGDATTAASNTSLTVSPLTFAHGAKVQVTSVVTPATGSGTPTGTVILKASNSTTGPVETGTLTSGTYSASVNDLPGGTYNLTANYGGDGSYSPSVSSPVSLTVTPEASTLTPTSLAPSRFFILGRQPILPTTSVALGTNFFLQVAIAGASGMGVPTGTVALSDGTKTFGTYPVSGGQIYVTCGPNTECDYPIGTYTFTATYSGDSSFNASKVTFPAFNITKGSIFYSVGVSNQLPSAGSIVIASVYFGFDPAVVPTGTVTLNRQDTGATLGTGTINSSGVATIHFAAPAGTYFVTASWPGDTNYISGGLSSYPEIITSGSGTTGSITTLVSAATKATLGQRTSFTITVKPAQAKSGAPTPTGTITLYTPTGQAANPVNLTGGTVITFYEWDLAGSQSVYAVYSGDNTYAGSSSPLAALTVSKATPTLSLTSIASYVAVGAQTSVTGSLLSSLSGTNAVAPSGSIQFYDSVGGATATAIGNPQALNTGNGNSIVATLAPVLTTGVHTVTAVYSGDANWATVTSNPVTLTVTTPDFTSVATPNPLTLGAGTNSALSIATTSILGYTGTVNVGCGGTLPVGVTCTSTTIQSGATGIITLSSVAPGTTTAPSTAAMSHAGWLAIPGGIGFAGLLLLILPRSRRRLHQLPLAMLVLSVALAATLVGCGGTPPAKTSTTPPPATPPAAQTTTIELTSSSSKAASGSKVQLSAIVSADDPLTGTITFYDGTTALGSPVTVTSGQATLSISTLTVGTHPLTAVYSGDTNNLKSTSSDVLQQTITGQFMLTVNTTSGTLSHSITVPATLQ
jgi:subtilase family serine protease